MIRGPYHLGQHALWGWCRSSLRCKSKSSGRWITRQMNDPHSKQAKNENFRSRAAYKLMEIDDKFRLFNKSVQKVVDLGFAPGAWTQVALARMEKQAQIIGVDLINCVPPAGAHFLQGDILSKRTHEGVREFFGDETDRPVDLVISDMMANTSGIKDNDHYASMELCDGALILSVNLLRDGGSLVMKYYTGKEEPLLVERMRTLFSKVYRFKPNACRNESRETYIIGVKRRSNVGLQDVFK
ncbi:rRNA methyltransferase 2, mitochondrial [Diutina catenulata]